MQHRVLSLIIYKFTYLHLLKTVIKTSLTKGLARQCNLSKTNHLHVLSAQNLIVLVTSRALQTSHSSSAISMSNCYSYFVHLVFCFAASNGVHTTGTLAGQTVTVFLYSCAIRKNNYVPSIIELNTLKVETIVHHGASLFRHVVP